MFSVSSRPTAWAKAGSASARPFTLAWPSNRIRVFSSVSGPSGLARKLASTRSTEPCSTRICPASKAPSIVGLASGPVIDALRSSLPTVGEPGMAPAWTLKSSRPFADLSPSKSSRAAADTRCRPPGRAMLELSLNWTSPLSVVWPAKTGWTTPGASPSRREFEIERQPPPGALPRDDHLPVRPHVRARVEVELRGEIVERARAIEGELDRRQAGKIGEMGKNTASGLGGVHVERQPIGGGNVSRAAL